MLTRGVPGVETAAGAADLVALVAGVEAAREALLGGVWRLRDAGWTWDAIATVMGVTRPSVTRWAARRRDRLGRDYWPAAGGPARVSGRSPAVPVTRAA